MHTLYNILIHITSFGLGIVALFSKKMNLFVKGRKDVFNTLAQKISPTDKTIWFHCASLGEFEQGVPIIEELKKRKADHKIVISFFSPSGFEAKKNTALADVVVYLPLDTPNNAKKFIQLVHPSFAFFIKYEFWPNYLFELQNRSISTLLISGVFNADQIFFKSYGGFMRKALDAFDHFFVQNENSATLLKRIDLNNVTVSGDTRFDRVSHQLTVDNTLAFADDFIEKKLCIVCGSTWPEDEELLLDFINTCSAEIKFIIAPHKIEVEQIEKFRKKINKKTILHSEKDNQDLSQYSVMIIDCIGLLGRLYSYANIAYIGGAAGKTGLHNILEAATFSIPIVIGKNFNSFPEAIQLKNLAGLFSVKTSEECTEILNKLVDKPTFRLHTGMISGHFVHNNVGATQIVTNYISSTSI